ncbi:hypothetical protein P8610_05085 [Fictibacillus sp. UD]|uniref:hypothetical protein n=1 Tax=Fictibacillus sp. UD TaxID=3038777 RepID=UPI0037453370
MFQNTRISAQVLKSIIKSRNLYGITNLEGYGQVIVQILNYGYDTQQNIGVAYLKIFTPSEDIGLQVDIKEIGGWVPYTGPIPPQFGHQGGLPGGMGGQGYGQGQTFPSSWGGQGTPGGWGTWGY